ncbi:unnamed protein product [Brassica oleracea var. botrytis]|uniref:(rape) hypothetical protein n=1 Tax=Brassica napus TaxID=3708 RepID=A0A816MBJ2_BRANA|nr:unnamed protein product [Brassica napus]
MSNLSPIKFQIYRRVANWDIQQRKMNFLCVDVS